MLDLVIFKQQNVVCVRPCTFLCYSVLEKLLELFENLGSDSIRNHLMGHRNCTKFALHPLPCMFYFLAKILFSSYTFDLESTARQYAL